MVEPLVQRSLEIIRQNQAPSGAYVASPNFKTYHYAWFRDGTFVAYAMDVMGEHASARRFYDWSAQTIMRHADAARQLIAQVQRGATVQRDQGLHTRYTLDGEVGKEAWSNFQLDGFGTWLWGIVEHLRRTGDKESAARWQNAMELIARYIATLWQQPNYDCWEEFGDRIHISTLAALYGGLRAYAERENAPAYARSAQDIRAFVLEHGIADGHLCKFIGNPAVDAALIGAAVPYQLLALDDPRMIATIACIERDLRREGGGVHRYRADTYYGGGEWILLTAWLGWYYQQMGDETRARDLLGWVTQQADPNFELPEQVAIHLNSPEEYALWVARWGEIAKPLLWSHAKYLILWQALHP